MPASMPSYKFVYDRGVPRYFVWDWMGTSIWENAISYVEPEPMYQVLSFPVDNAVFCDMPWYTIISCHSLEYLSISQIIAIYSLCYRKAEDLIHRFWLDIWDSIFSYEIAFSHIDAHMSVSYDISWHTSVIYEISNLVRWHGRYDPNHIISYDILVCTHINLYILVQRIIQSYISVYPSIYWYMSWYTSIYSYIQVYCSIY